MLVESLVKATVELQGFRVRRVTGDVTGSGVDSGLAVCAALRSVRAPGPVSGHTVGAPLSPCPAVGDSRDAGLCAAAGCVWALWHGACRGAALGGRPAAVHPSLAGHDRDVDAGDEESFVGSAALGCIKVPSGAGKMEIPAKNGLDSYSLHTRSVSTSRF